MAKRRVRRASKAKARPATPRFPARLYVTRAGEDSGMYFDADTDIEGKDADDEVAIYEYVETRRKTIIHGLE